ncbi:TPA: 16S rRNA (adenine(1518)-N(6)/adenine(1519)-N(6))-dimethyltransferase, partial [Legionella pneumophila subsp. pneumophila]|nr:16S rRNA (adenine(1518)-N(6)/adenine(1519)-N(6))-dimethyltransferase [Legionella pneumophila subsp. pneumophila]
MRHSPRKRFGQNFLQDKYIINEILRAINPLADDNMLEIGPGLGALTQPLLQKLSRLTAIEIDTDLQSYLTCLLASQGKLNLIPADALTVDF